MKQAQAGMEFVYVMGLVLLISTIIIVVAGSKLGDIQNQARLAQLVDVARSARQEIFIAADVEDGYRREFILEQKIRGRPYNITTSANTLLVSEGELEILYTVPQVTGNFQKGQNTIRREAGELYLNA
jgi:hypothetical protein